MDPRVQVESERSGVQGSAVWPMDHGHSGTNAGVQPPKIPFDLFNAKGHSWYTQSFLK